MVSFGLIAVLESQDNIVDVAYDDDIPLRATLPPLLCPGIQNVVEVDIRQQGRYDSPNAIGNFEFERQFPYERTPNQR